jgi:predicted XRE-type DNA-binding protein
MADIVKGSDNVFADLGSADAETRALKAALVRRIANPIKQERLTQAAGAQRMETSQPDVSRMLKGQFRPFSLKRLMPFLNALGQDVEIAVRRPSRRRARSKLIVHSA